MCFLFLKKEIYLFETQIYMKLGGWKREKKTERTSTCCLTSQMTINSQGQTRLKLGTRNSIWVSHMDARTQGLGLFSASFPGILAGSLIGSATAETQTGAHVTCQHYRQHLNLLCHHNTITLHQVVVTLTLKR